MEGWTPVSGMAGNVTTVDLLLSPKQIKLVKSFLKCNNIKFSIVLHDLQRAIGDYYDPGAAQSFIVLFQTLRTTRPGDPTPRQSSRAPA